MKIIHWEKRIRLAKVLDTHLLEWVCSSSAKHCGCCREFGTCTFCFFANLMTFRCCCFFLLWNAAKWFTWSHWEDWGCFLLRWLKFARTENRKLHHGHSQLHWVTQASISFKSIMLNTHEIHFIRYWKLWNCFGVKMKAISYNCADRSPDWSRILSQFSCNPVKHRPVKL